MIFFIFILCCKEVDLSSPARNTPTNRRFLLTKTSWLMLFVLPSSRTASSSSSLTTKIRWSRLVRLRQMDVLSRETTLFTESLPQPQRRRMNGSTASSESNLNSLYDDYLLEVLCLNVHLPRAELPSAKTRSTRCWLLGRRRCRLWRGCRAAED